MYENMTKPKTNNINVTTWYFLSGKSLALSLGLQLKSLIACYILGYCTEVW